MSRNPTKGLQALAFVGMASLQCGCDAIVGVLEPKTTVRLINNSDFAVEGVIYYDDEDDTIEEILEQTGTRRPFALASGGQSSFSVPCDELRALILSDADLQIIGDIGPSASTDVLREGDDFECGEVITLTFDHSAAVMDFDVTVAVSRNE